VNDPSLATISLNRRITVEKKAAGRKWGYRAGRVSRAARFGFFSLRFKPLKSY
jgi:hypothetical protein